MNQNWRDYVMGLALFLFLAALIALPRACRAMTPAQIQALNAAASVAAVLDDARVSREVDFTLTFQALIGQESSYCTKLMNHKDPSYGCGALQPKTAANIAGRYVSPRELVRDTKLNLRLSARHLHALITRFGWARGLYAYNHGKAAAEKATARQVERGNLSAGAGV